MATSTSPSRTPRGQGDRLRERLVQAGVEMIDEGTEPARVSIRAVTRRAGVSPTAFYLHFANHDELLGAMVERSFTEFRDALRAGAAAGGDPAARLNAAGMAYTEFADRWPARYALNFVYVRAPESEPPAKPAVADDAFDDLVALVLDYLAPDDPRREEADLLARGIWSGLHGYVTLRQARTGKGWPPEHEFVPRLSLTWLGEPAG